MSHYSEWRSGHADHWQLLSIEEGELNARFTTTGLTLQAGSLLLSAPGMGAHYEHALGSRVINVLFSAIPSPGWPVPWNMLKLPLSVEGVNTSRLSDLPKGMESLHTPNEQEDRWRNADGAMQARFAVDQALWELFKRAIEQEKIRDLRQRPRWLRDSLRAVDRKLHDPDFQVKAFAGLTGCSPDHLNRTIRKSDGMTAQEFLRQLRLERAAHILQHTPETETNAIARQCGFRSARQFRDQWKRQFGEGIRDFRKQN